MRGIAIHSARVFRTPWPGVHATVVHSSRHFERHTHPQFGFGMVTWGAHRSASGRGTVVANTGDVITVNPGEVHDGEPYGSVSRLWHMVYAEPAVIGALRDEAADEEPTTAEFEQPVSRVEPIRRAVGRLFVRLHDWQDAGRMADVEAIACDETWVDAVAHLIGPAAAPLRSLRFAPDVSLRRVSDRLADAGLAAPSLAELAHLAGVSRFQLLRRFKAAYGMPPHAWLIQRRLERAQSRIRLGEPIAQVAVDCGFADQSHLTRLFVRRFSYTPGAWQRAMR